MITHTPFGTPIPGPDMDDGGVIVPDTDEPWLPAVLNAATGVPAAAAALGTAMVAAGMNWHRGPLLALTVSLFAAVLVVLAVIDWKTLRLPNSIVLPLYPVLGAVVALAALTGSVTGAQALTAVAGMAGAFAVYWVLAFVTGGLGWGDVKLAGLLGLMCGLESGYAAVLGAVVLPMILGGAVAIPLRLAGHGGREIPFGPFMSAGALLILLLPGVLGPLSRGL